MLQFVVGRDKTHLMDALAVGGTVAGEKAAGASKTMAAAGAIKTTAAASETTAVAAIETAAAAIKATAAIETTADDTAAMAS